MEKEQLQKMQKLKKKVEEQKVKESEQKIIVEVILYYGKIQIKGKKEKQEEVEIYGIKEKIGKKEQIKFYANNKVIATVGKEGTIQIVPKFADQIKEVEFLAKLERAKEQLQDKEPISLEELEQKEQQRQKGVGTKQKKKSKQKNKEEKEQEKKKEEEKEDLPKKAIGKNDREIKMNQHITPDKTIADIIPEIKEKGCKKVKIRTYNNINFQVYGIDKDGNEIELKSLQQTEGTNPTQAMIKISGDGTKMEQTKVSTMLKIQAGKNEKTENEGLGIKVGEMGIEEILYYRRDVKDRYVGVPVGLETTNQKRNNREVQEFASKSHNTEVGDEMALIEEAASRCNMSVKGFLKQYEKAKGNSIKERIDNTEEEINNQYRGKDKLVK